jgi:peptide deformylase
VAVLRIHTFPDPLLTRTSERIAEIDGRVAGYVADMVETMYAANGVGLAAPQVGLLERAIVVDTDSENRGLAPLCLLNPKVVEAEGDITWEEGCLSVVDYTAEVQRSARVLVSGWSVDQEEVRIEATGLKAVCLQHEIDHLDGKLFLDHLSPLKRSLYRKRLKKIKRSGELPDDGVPRI